MNLALGSEVHSTCPDVKNVRFIVPGMSFRVRVRVRGLVLVPLGP